MPKLDLPPLHRQRAPRRAGFTLLEVIVALSVLLVALMAMTSTTVVVHSVDNLDRERRLAVAALTQAIERVQARSSASINADGGWAPAVLEAYEAGGNPGPTFDVQGLTPWDGEAAVGTVQVVTDETATDTDLEARIGMPRDLDGDGLPFSADVSGDARLLPVVVRLRWKGAAGNRTLSQGFYVARM